jgi:hypothetical protein
MIQNSIVVTTLTGCLQTNLNLILNMRSSSNNATRTRSFNYGSRHFSLREASCRFNCLDLGDPISRLHSSDYRFRLVLGAGSFIRTGNSPSNSQMAPSLAALVMCRNTTLHCTSAVLNKAAQRTRANGSRTIVTSPPTGGRS